MIKKLFSFLLACVFVLVGALSVNAESASVAVDILSYKLSSIHATDVQAFIDGELCNKAGKGVEWYALALLSSGETYDYSNYRHALEKYLSENKTGGASTMQRNALVLLALGSESDSIGQIFYDTAGKEGIMSLVFALHLARYGCESERYSANSIADELLLRITEDGGWSLGGTKADVDVTAMTVQALAYLATSRSDVKEALERATKYLSSAQLENGGFSSYGAPNAESCAQVIIALCSLGIDPETSEDFIKNSNSVVDALSTYKSENGGFSHTLGGEVNDTATVQALMAFTALDKMRQGGKDFYDLGNISYEMPSDLQASDKDLTGSDNTPVKNESIQEKQGFFEENRHKIIIISVIFDLFVIGAILLFVLGKRKINNYIFLAIICFALIATVIFSDIKAPGDYYGKAEEKEDPIGSVSISIRCDVLSGENDSRVPSDAVILEESEFLIEKGDTVLDILIEAAKKHSISIDEAEGYVSGIANIYEYDFGDLSGWTYYVNGESPSVGAGSYILSDGDRIEWKYTKILGEYGEK